MDTLDDVDIDDDVDTELEVDTLKGKESHYLKNFKFLQIVFNIQGFKKQSCLAKVDNSANLNLIRIHYLDEVDTLDDVDIDDDVDTELEVDTLKGKEG